jgi:putative ABC transport system permease protein
MTYVTVERIPEFGVRMALGASPRHVLALVLGHATQMAVPGMAAGLAFALSAARVMNTMLFGVQATDAITYAGVLLAVMPIVVWRPRFRRGAARADPVVALRNE